MIHAGLVNDVNERLKTTYDAYVFVLISYMSIFIDYLLILLCHVCLGLIVVCTNRQLPPVSSTVNWRVNAWSDLTGECYLPWADERFDGLIKGSRPLWCFSCVSRPSIWTETYVNTVLTPAIVYMHLASALWENWQCVLYFGLSMFLNNRITFSLNKFTLLKSVSF